MDVLRTEINEKRRAPISKKRNSDTKLIKANKFFNDMKRKLDKYFRFSAEKYAGYKILSCSKGPTILLEVEFDAKRSFTVQIAEDTFIKEKERHSLQQ